MQGKSFNSESGVSPVVGVMLMLVVTLIIAAIVSGFAGGLVGETSKLPQATISGTYSQSNGMTISHNGGDAIPITTTTVYVRPTKSFGADADKYAWEVNKSIIVTTGDDKKAWAKNADLSLNVTKSFIAGDTVRISADNLSYVQERPDGTTDYLDPNLGFKNSENIGLSFTIELQDSGGTTIAETTVSISG
ncbi:type IV pilin N-terminal domain-containing protein [Methanolacinia paynteri]|uniref:type IV pilin N-terminal domain-containing protein n=1 Tax=Methanolacinia paynteri TaxID=230356 RepID=UPI0006942BF3|nr:type IV pilin N-terminal domain-containing protein [Methanolacinia paynteri]